MIGWSYTLRYDGRDIPLSEGDLVLGRSRGCAIRIDEETVSRSHALLSIRGGEVTVRDLGSSNGLFVNGRREMREAAVRSGDVIGLGSATMSVIILPPSGAQMIERDPSSETLTRRLAAQEELKKIAVAPAPDSSPKPAPAEIVAAPSEEAPPVGLRFFSGLLDFSAALGLVMLCFLPAFVVLFTRASLRERTSSDPVFWVLVLFCSGLAISAVAVYFLAGWCGRGATPGQRIAGLRLVSVRDGRYVRSADVFWRLFGLGLCVLTAGLAFLTIFFDRGGRGFADRISRSRVVRG